MKDIKGKRFFSHLIDLFIGYLPVCMISCYIFMFFITALNIDNSDFETLPFIFIVLYLYPHYLIGMYIIALFYNELNLMVILDILSLLLIFIVSKTIYYTLCEMCFKNTIGKRMVGINIRDTNGFKISLGKRLLRNFLKSISDLILIPYIICLFKKDNQMFYDKICETKIYDLNNIEKRK